MEPATTNPIPEPSDELVLKVARAICWAFSEETDDCSSVCLNAKRCMTDDVANSFKRDASAAIAAMPELTELQQRVKQLEELLDCAIDEHDQHFGKRIKADDPHWSVQARPLLSDKVED